MDRWSAHQDFRQPGFRLLGGVGSDQTFLELPVAPLFQCRIGHQEAAQEDVERAVQLGFERALLEEIIEQSKVQR